MTAAVELKALNTRLSARLRTRLNMYIRWWWKQTKGVPRSKAILKAQKGFFRDTVCVILTNIM